MRHLPCRALTRCVRRWNFEKFLLSAHGDVVARFRPRTEPDAPEVRAAIEAQLG